MAEESVPGDFFPMAFPPRTLQEVKDACIEVAIDLIRARDEKQIPLIDHLVSIARRIE